MWVNHRLLEVTEPLSREQLHRSLPIGQGSVWKTLTHLMAAEHVWLEALLGNESPLLRGDLPNQLPGNQNGADAIENHLDLRSRWVNLDRRWDTYLESLDHASLDDSVFKVSTSSGLGNRHATRRSDVLLHVCTHAQYTTAQLINMLRQLGCEQLPDVMLITMARQEASSNNAS
jgi:uncharacterized damage-inducible protein DinB